MNGQTPAIILTAILSPLVCFVAYLYWKMSSDLKKTMRKNELVENLKKDYFTRRAIVQLIIENIETDYLFQQAIISLVIEQLQKDWRLEKAVTTITRKAN